MNIILEALLVVILLFGLFAATAYRVYNRVKPISRACIGCPNPARVNGYDLYYRELGVQQQLAPVVLLHGGPGHSSLSFKNCFDHLSSLTRVIYYDQRGSGNSQIKSNPTDYTIEELVEELEILRRDVILSEKIILIAHSFGSALGQRYALKYPAHVEKLVIISGIRINNGMSSRFIWKWLGPALYAVGLGFPPSDGKAADNWFTKLSDRDDAKRLYDPQQVHLFENFGTTSFVPWREVSLSLTGSDFKEQLRQLHVSTLFIYGAADVVQTGKPVADELSSILPNFSSVGFEHSGHWPYLEQPDEFRQVLVSFLTN
ncbi:MAG: alpha/beta hydrolase [Chloroflexota bacterium]